MIYLSISFVRKTKQMLTYEMKMIYHSISFVRKTKQLPAYELKMIYRSITFFRKTKQLLTCELKMMYSEKLKINFCKGNFSFFDSLSINSNFLRKQ